MTGLVRSVVCSRVWLLALVLLGGTACGFAQESHVGNLTGHAASGKQLFPRYCNGCHGVRGDGNGTFAPYLEPRPRDFTIATFKCRSTPTGSLPVDQDMYNTMMRGIDTTPMPSWAPLTPQIRVDIIAYLKTFGSRFGNETPAPALAIPPEKAVTIEGIRHGAEVYEKLECASCHGKLGRGNGPKAATLTDIKHMPDAPYDFTLTSRFKCGANDRELYRTLITGMDGSPMESYYGKASPDELWDLVHFVSTLQPARDSEALKVLKAAGGNKTLALATH